MNTASSAADRDRNTRVIRINTRTFNDLLFCFKCVLLPRIRRNVMKSHTTSTPFESDAGSAMATDQCTTLIVPHSRTLMPLVDAGLLDAAIV